MKDNFKGAIQISATTGVILIVALFFLVVYNQQKYILGVVFGYAISLINVLFAFLSISWAFEKPNKIFFKVVLGGMGIRFLVLITAIFFVHQFTQILLNGFILSLVVFYIILQFFEIRFIQKNLANRKALT